MAELVRDYASGAVAGLAAGIVVGGVGGRIVMRLASLIAGSDALGMTTANGNIVGDFTLNGTIGLIVFAGALPGVFGGLLYAALGPWLVPLGRWRGVAFGVLLLAGLGSTVIDPANVDFVRFISAALAALMFATLFVAFGSLTAWIYGRLGRIRRGDAGGPQVLLWVGVLSSVLVIALLVITFVAALTGQGEGAETAAVFFVVAVPTLLIATVARAYAETATAVSYALLGLPLLVGLQRTASALLTLLAR